MRKKSVRRYFDPVVSLLLLAILIAFAAFRLHQLNIPSPPAAFGFESGVSPAPAETDAPEWYLTLVNRWNPISAQVQSEIELTVLSNGKSVDSRIYPALQKMFDDMRAQGIYPIVASGYRTQEEQQQIYDEKMEEYIAQGYSKAQAKDLTEQWVAPPGTSEHQLGLGIDINADGIHSYGYEVYDWLRDNAHTYGFINRYPQDKTDITGISNEPWHYRYVGVEAATEIYNRGICLEEYLGNVHA